MLDKVKLALRISHNLLNNDIEDTIAAARAELIRAGVAADKANDDTNELVVLAIKTYCLSIYSADAKVREGYTNSFAYMLDNLRKSSGYNV